MLFIVVILIQIIAGRAAPVGDDHAGEPQVFLLEAIQDGAGSHDLDVVLVGGDGQVGGAGEGLFDGQTVGDEDFGSGKVELHLKISG